MAQSRAESTWEITNDEDLLTNSRRISLDQYDQFERINKKKICRQKMSIMFNEICINQEMLPKKKNIYIYVCVCVCVCVCVRALVYIYIKID